MNETRCSLDLIVTISLIELPPSPCQNNLAIRMQMLAGCGPPQSALPPSSGPPACICYFHNSRRQRRSAKMRAFLFSCMHRGAVQQRSRLNISVVFFENSHSQTDCFSCFAPVVVTHKNQCLLLPNSS